jgi:tetratricopeptide (TPR) repeat protein
MENPSLALTYLGELWRLAPRHNNEVMASNARSEMAQCWQDMGEFEKAAQELRSILDAEGKTPQAAARMVTARLRLGAVYLQDGSGRVGEALSLFDEAAKGAQLIMPNHAAAGEARNSAAAALWELGRYADSLVASEDARRIYQAAGYVPGLAQAWNNQGIALQKLGRLRSARGALLKALDIADSIGYARSVGAAHINLGDILLAMGDYAGARSHGEAAVKVARMLGRRPTEANGLLVQALAAEGQGAVKLARQALETSRDRSCAGVRPFVSADCAWIMMVAGECDEAAALLEGLPLMLGDEMDNIRETTVLGLRAIKSGRGDEGFAPDTLSGIMKSLGLSCASRRARTAIRLHERGVSNIDADAISALQARWVMDSDS